jgi:L-fuculose-phosphate aldolase
MTMNNYLSEQEARRAVLDVGKRIYDRGYVAANDGNISCRINDNTILVTPTGVSKGFMHPDALVKMNLDGTVLDGGKPSSEVKMHLRVYQENPDITRTMVDPKRLKLRR